MENLIVFLIVIVLSALLTVGYYFAVVLPRLLWRHVRCLWETFGGAAPDRDAAGTGSAEPARETYVHSGAPRELRLLWRRSRAARRGALWEGDAFVADRLRAATQPQPSLGQRETERARRARRARTGCASVLLRPFVLLSRAAVALIAAVLCLPATALPYLVWAVWFALWAVLCGACRIVDRTARRLHGGTLVCPYPRCGRAVALPVRVCPACGAGHRGLVPGRYGALRHVCRCGTRLPASAAFGARRLEARCPGCARSLPAGTAYTRTRAVVLVSGPGARRDAVRRQGLAQMRRRVEELGGTGGAEASELSELSEAAAVRPGGLRGGRTVILCDPHRDAFAAQSTVDALDGLRHARGLALVVDGLALPGVRRALGAEERVRAGAAPASSQDPEQAVARVLHTVRTLPARRQPRRIAVVLANAPAVRRTSLGAELEDGGDAAVRRWLLTAGAGNLLRTLERSGSRVRCLAADEAEGAGEAEGGGRPTALGELLLWTAGVRLAPLRLPGLRRLRVRTPTRIRSRTPDRTTSGAPPAAAPRGAHTVRGVLLLAHLTGFVALPLALALFFSGSLPPSAVFGLAGAYDKWRRPLAGSSREVDLTAYRTGVRWPRVSSSFSAPGSSPAMAQAGRKGSWSTVGSKHRADWLDLDFGVPVRISRVDLDFDPASVKKLWPSFILKARTDSGWAYPSYRDMTNDKTSPSPGHYGLKPIHRYEIPFRTTARSVRVRVGGYYDIGTVRNLRLREVRVRARSSSLLRLRPKGGRLRIENATARDLHIDVRPPVLPAGWHAEQAGRPPREVGARGTAVARWKITAPGGGEADRTAPAGFAVRIAEDGRTATAVCQALLSRTASGLRAVPVTCDGG